MCRCFAKILLAEVLMDNIKTGWETEKRTHFDEIVVNYDKARWEYPAELFTDIFEYKGTNSENTALEIGAGTGKAATPFLTAGYNVTAVELGRNMADFISDKFKDYSGFEIIVSSFEEAELTENSYDVIYAASAFHWVNAEIGCPKAFRLLKNGGVFALFRNNTVGTYEVYDDMLELYEKYYLSVYPNNTRGEKNTHENLSAPSGIHRGYRFYDMKDYGFTDITMKFYEVTNSYSADEYVALLDTYADHRSLPESNKTALYAGIRESIERHGGFCKLDCLFQLYMGRKP
jgi:ubiquinone/menaquinone biosynthesis C-methylase UbiE